MKALRSRPFSSRVKATWVSPSQAPAYIISPAPFPAHVRTPQNARRPNVQMSRLSPDSADSPSASTENALTTEQATVLHLALDGASLFIGGKAGTGKSFLLRRIAQELRSRGLNVSVSASTGIAALSIEGNTFHSTFGVPVVTADCATCAERREWWRQEACHDDRESVEAESEAHDGFGRPTPAIHFSQERLIGLHVLIVDEVSLLHAGYLEALERCCRRVPGNNPRKPFGGVQVILSGDFLQLSPFDSATAVVQNAQHSVACLADDPTLTMRACDRYMCPGIWRGRIVVEESDNGEVQHPANNGEDTDVPGIQDAGLSPSAAATPVPAALALKGFSAKMRIPRHRRPSGWYQTRPLYESYVFQRCLVHVQLYTPSRHRADPLFLAELNLLRVGQMPWRLARSAYLNPPDDAAIRLFPTNSAVANYNARRMLDLPGSPVRFASTLSLAAVKKRRGYQPRTTTLGDSSPARSARSQPVDPPRGLLSAPIALTCVRDTPTAPSKSRYARVKGTGRPFSYKDAERFLSTLTASLSAETATPPVMTHAFVLPTTYQDSTRFGRIVVRVEGDSAEAVGMWHTRLEHAARCRVLADSGTGWGAHTPTARVMERAHVHAAVRRHLGRAGACASPWRLIQVNQMTAAHVLALARPALQAQFASTHKTDPLLCDKELKEGCRVMLLRNVTHTLVNGALGTIERFVSVRDAAPWLPTEAHLKIVLSPCMRVRNDPDSGFGRDSAQGIRVPIVRMDHTNTLVAIPWITVPVPGTPHSGFFRSHIECLPLTPAYAFTVHKTQGITFDQSVLFDGERMFPCDHLIYVAASRVRRFSQLRFVNVSPRAVTVHTPSLHFCEHIPDVKRAVDKWAAWKSAGKATRCGLFIPNWKSTN